MRIDIRTRDLTDPPTIVVARPGAHYRMFAQIVSQSIVGPELPSLFIDGEAINFSDRMGARINRSKEIRKWFYLGQPIGEEPSLDLDSYDDSSDGSNAQLVRLAEYYLRTARKGDLIVIPPGDFSGKAHIGEFTADSDEAVLSATDYYGNFKIPVRSVKWIGTIEKTDLPPRIIDALRKPTALILVGRSEEKTFFDAAFRNYHTASRYCAVFDVTSPNFDTTSGSIIPAFFNFVAANTAIIDNGSEKLLSFADGAFADLGDYAPQLAIDIQSPGVLSIISAQISPIVASALLVIALSVGPSAANPAVLDKITIENSEATRDDPCAVLVQDYAKTHIRLLGYDRWKETCERLKKAEEHSGLDSEAIFRK